MKLKQSLKRTAVAAALLWAGAASATVYNFDLTGSFTGHWAIDTAAISPVDVSEGSFFRYINVPGTPEKARMDFFAYGAIEITGVTADNYQAFVYSFSIENGEPLYSGSEYSPIFKVGTYSLISAIFNPPGTYALKISEVGAVPEPETYAMLLAGLGLVGFVTRRRQKRA